MDSLWYCEPGRRFSRKEIRPLGRLGVKRWPALTGLAVLAALWWLGILGTEALFGLIIFGAIVGGDRGPGPDEPWPRRRREADWVKLLLELLKQREPVSTPEPTWPPPYRMGKLPTIDLEPMPSPPPLPSFEPRDREKLIKAMEEGFAKRFREVMRKEAPFSEKPIDLGRGIRLSPPTLHFQMLAPQRPEEETFSQMLERFLHEPPTVEETFSEMLMRFMEEPEPREETFSEKLERHLQGPADFRTEGEKRRDERQAEARREPPRQQPSPMERLLAQLEAERQRKSTQRKERKPKAPSSTKKTADEVWEETTTQAKKLNALKKRTEAGEAHPIEEVLAVAALPDSLVERSAKLARSRAEAREKVFELLEKGNIPEVVPLGKGASFEEGSLRPPVEPSVVQAISGMFEVFQDPETIWTPENGKIIGRDAKGNMLAEGSVVGSSTFYTLNSAGEFAAINPPVAAGVSLEFKVKPPANEHLTAYYGLGRHLSAGVIYGSDEDGRPATGISINIGLSLPLGIPYVLSTPIDPREVLKNLPEEFTPGA